MRVDNNLLRLLDASLKAVVPIALRCLRLGFLRSLLVLLFLFLFALLAVRVA